MRRTAHHTPKIPPALPLWLALLASMALCSPIAEEFGGALPGGNSAPRECPDIPAPEGAEHLEEPAPPSSRLIAGASGSAASAGEV